MLVFFFWWGFRSGGLLALLGVLRFRIGDFRVQVLGLG